jgi:hypothetical protein
MTPDLCLGMLLLSDNCSLPMYVVDNSLDFRIYLQQSLSFIQNRVSAAPPVMIAVTQASAVLTHRLGRAGQWHLKCCGVSAEHVSFDSS